MGRPRIKTIDDSAPEAEVKKQKTSTRSSRGKNKEEKATEVKSDKASRLSEEGEIRRESTSSDVHEQDRTGSEPPAGGEESELEKRDQTNKGAKETKKQKPGKAKPRSKKYQEIAKDLDRTKTYSLPEAVDMAKKLSYSKFNATLEAHINTSQTGIRGLVSLPYAKGKKIRILAFGPSHLQLEGVIFGSDSTIDTISKGKVDFDLVITTPEWMPKLAKVARILGPKGLMPNPKNGTIASGEAGLQKAVEGFQAGKTEYKTESKAPVIHVAMGKLNQPNDELIANIKTLYQTIGKSRVKKITLSPTMGPGVKINLTSL